MRVLVCGDRNWPDKDAIRRELSKLEPGTTLIHGGARGADRLSGIVAEELGIKVDKVYYANWPKYGRSAGPIRNQEMLTLGKPNLVLAFHPNLSQSKGTKDMVERATRAGVPVKLFTS